MSSSSIRPLARLVDVGRATDERDDLVERVERLGETAVDVGALLGLGEPVSACGAG